MYEQKSFENANLNKKIKNYLKYLKLRGSANHNSQLDCEICKIFYNTKDTQAKGPFKVLIDNQFTVQVKLRSDCCITFDNFKKLKNGEKVPGWVDKLNTNYALFVFADDDKKTVHCKAVAAEELKDYLNICRNWKKVTKDKKTLITENFKETNFDSNSLYFRLTPIDS